jgi:hypothetical protein
VDQLGQRPHRHPAVGPQGLDDLPVGVVHRGHMPAGRLAAGHMSTGTVGGEIAGSHMAILIRYLDQ